jgi:hypothetical protein
MDEKIVEQILDDLYSSFEDAETQSAAILLFLKDQGIATEEKLAPYFEQAGRASDVRWRAARVRMASLLASAMKAPEAAAQKQPTEDAAEKQNSGEAAAAAPATPAGKDKNSGAATKAETSNVKQEPSEQKSQTAPAKKSEQASEQKSRQASEQESSDANKAEKDAA